VSAFGFKKVMDILRKWEKSLEQLHDQTIIHEADQAVSSSGTVGRIEGLRYFLRCLQKAEEIQNHQAGLLASILVECRGRSRNFIANFRLSSARLALSCPGNNLDRSSFVKIPPKREYVEGCLDGTPPARRNPVSKAFSRRVALCAFTITDHCVIPSAQEVHQS